MNLYLIVNEAGGVNFDQFVIAKSAREAVKIYWRDGCGEPFFPRSKQPRVRVWTVPTTVWSPTGPAVIPWEKLEKVTL